MLSSLSRRRLFWAMVPLIVLLTPRPVAAAWHRVDAPNVVVVGEVAEADLRRVAAGLEAYRETFRRMLGDRAVAPIVPTVVVVLSSDGSFGAFAPSVNGQTIPSRGFFLTTADLNYIVVVNPGD